MTNGIILGKNEFTVTAIKLRKVYKRTYRRNVSYDADTVCVCAILNNQDLLKIKIIKYV